MFTSTFIALGTPIIGLAHRINIVQRRFPMSHNYQATIQLNLSHWPSVKGHKLFLNLVKRPPSTPMQAAEY